MGRFLLFAISLFLHAFAGWRLVAPIVDVWPALALLLGVVVAASAVLMPASLLATRARQGGAATERLIWIGMLAMGWFSSVFVLVVLRGLAATAMLVAGLPLAEIAAFERNGSLVIAALSIVATVVGFFNARRTARVVTVRLPVEQLPQALEGFTLVQLSDVHVGPTIKRRYLESIVDRTNGVKPDAVVITGDLVDGRVDDLLPHVAALSGLVSREGTFFVTGNHEYYSGAHAWIDALRQLGIRVLMNEHVVIARGDAKLVLAGVPDTTAHHFDAAHAADPARAIAGAPVDAALRVLLAHQPRAAASAEAAGFDVQLSGHTHGGQFWPWNHFVRLQQPYTSGLHRLGRLRVYVSRGTGYWGPPTRLFAPSEITCVRFVRA